MGRGQQGMREREGRCQNHQDALGKLIMDLLRQSGPLLVSLSEAQLKEDALLLLINVGS